MHALLVWSQFFLCYIKDITNPLPTVPPQEEFLQTVGLSGWWITTLGSGEAYDLGLVNYHHITVLPGVISGIFSCTVQLVIYGNLHGRFLVAWDYGDVWCYWLQGMSGVLICIIFIFQRQVAFIVCQSLISCVKLLQ